MLPQIPDVWGVILSAFVGAFATVLANRKGKRADKRAEQWERSTRKSMWDEWDRLHDAQASDLERIRAQLGGLAKENDRLREELVRTREALYQAELELFKYRIDEKS